MPAEVILDGVSISQIQRTGTTGQAQYSGVIRFTVALQQIDGVEVKFEFNHPFAGADNIDTHVEVASKFLAGVLQHAVTAAKNWMP